MPIYVHSPSEADLLPEFKISAMNLSWKHKKQKNHCVSLLFPQFAKLMSAKILATDWGRSIPWLGKDGWAGYVSTANELLVEASALGEE